MSPARGLLIVISGPSGVGKDTLIQRLRELDPSLQYSISCTTRKPRQGEVDAINYFFVSRERFEDLIREGYFLEHAAYNGNYYGTPAAAVEKARAVGRDILLKIEVQGAEQVRKRAPDGLFIFIAPPSNEELVRRQELRQGADPKEDMAERRKIAETEMKLASQYDFVVINDDLERAAGEVLAIIRKARERQT
ncbi:MAG TPA: guanylate kinase [Candidatus Micrarchaeaceae archaeon]|nr:guanylate kinase [Candidatus Micrarchaeaceae archaeon]